MRFRTAEVFALASALLQQRHVFAADTPTAAAAAAPTPSATATAPNCLSLADSEVCPGFKQYSVDPAVLSDDSLLPPTVRHGADVKPDPATDGVATGSEADKLIRHFMADTYLPFLTQDTLGCDLDHVASPGQSRASAMNVLSPRYTATFVCAIATRASWRRGCTGPKSTSADPQGANAPTTIEPPQLCSRGCTLHEDSIRRISAEWRCQSPAATDPAARQSRYYDLLPCAPLSHSTAAADGKPADEAFTNATDLALAQDATAEPASCIRPELNEPATCGFYPNVVDLCVLCAMILSEPTRALDPAQIDNATMTTILTGPLAAEGTLAHRAELLQCCADAPCPSIAQAAYDTGHNTTAPAHRHAVIAGAIAAGRTASGHGHSHQLKAVGLALGLTILLALFVLAFWYFLRRRADARRASSTSVTAAAPAYSEKPEDAALYRRSSPLSPIFAKATALGARLRQSIYWPTLPRASSGSAAAAQLESQASATSHVLKPRVKAVDDLAKPGGGEISVTTRDLGAYGPDSPIELSPCSPQTPRSPRAAGLRIQARMSRGREQVAHRLRGFFNPAMIAPLYATRPVSGVLSPPPPPLGSAAGLPRYSGTSSTTGPSNSSAAGAGASAGHGLATSGPRTTTVTQSSYCADQLGSSCGKARSPLHQVTNSTTAPHGSMTSAAAAVPLGAGTRPKLRIDPLVDKSTVQMHFELEQPTEHTLPAGATATLEPNVAAEQASAHCDTVSHDRSSETNSGSQGAARVIKSPTGSTSTTDSELFDNGARRSCIPMSTALALDPASAICMHGAERTATASASASALRDHASAPASAPAARDSAAAAVELKSASDVESASKDPFSDPPESQSSSTTDGKR